VGRIRFNILFAPLSPEAWYSFIMNNLIHAAWDELAISDMFSPILGPQKSIKTRCNKRVAFGRVAHNGVTCPDCLADRSFVFRAVDVYTSTEVK
jgi:hypothetical protein